jgi:hypothetical protein
MLSKNGVSTTIVKDQFNYEVFYSEILRGERVQWDYRDVTGKLHSGVSKTLELAKQSAAKFGYRE